METLSKEYFYEVIERIMSGEKPLSYSALSAFIKSPKHYYEYVTCKETTSAMEEGKIFHLACLEPDKYKNKYFFLDDKEICEKIGGKRPRSTSSYKEWVDSRMVENPGKELLSKDDYDLYLRMSNSVRYNSSSKIYLGNMEKAESSFDFEMSDFKLTGKIDGLGHYEKTLGFLFDLKKVADASFQKVKWDIQRMNYDMQAALYCSASEISEYFLIYIDKGCNITVVRLTDQTLQKGHDKLELALDNFRQCAEQDLWQSSYEFYNKGYVNY